jgi:hypothetical protein
MAEQVVTDFVIRLEQYDAQINAAIAKMEAYLKETQDANKGNKDLSGSAGSAAAKVKELGVASDKAGKGMKDVKAAANDLGKELGNTVNELTGLGGAFGRVGQAAIKLGRTLIVALGPVGIAVTAIVAIFAALTKVFFGTERGSETLDRALSILTTVFDRLLGVAQKVAFALVDTFKNPKQAVADLWEAIKTNIVNRITALADQFKFLGEIIAGVFTLDTDRITAGVSGFGEATVQALTGVDDLAGKVADGFNKIKKEVVDAGKEGLQIEKLKEQLEDLALVQATRGGELTRIIAEQMDLARDGTKTDEARAAAAQAAIAAQNELSGLAAKQNKLEVQRLALQQKQSDTSIEGQIELANLKAQGDQIEADRINANKRALAIVRGIEAENTAAAIEEAEKAKEARVKAEEEALEAAIARVQGQDALDLDLSNRRAALLQGDLEKLKKAQEDELLLRSIKGESELEILADQAAQRDAIIKEIQDAEINAMLAKFDAEFEAAEKAGADIAALTQVQQEELAAFKAEKTDEDLERQKQFYDAVENLRQQDLAAEQSIQDAQKDALQAGGDILLDQLAKTEEGAKLALAAQKAQAVAQVIIATSAAIQAALAQAVIAVGPVAGPLLAAPAIAKLKIGAALNIATILAQAIGGAYEGGIVGQGGVGTKIHSGRDGYASMVHKGEHIMPTDMTKKYMPYLEMMRGGNFDTWLASMRNVSAYGNGDRTAAPGFNDRRLVGALGGVGSVGEQRKQTELLAMLNSRMGRRRNKRYRAA